MRCPEEFSGEFIRYNIKKCKGKPSFIRINFSSYYMTPINKNARFTHASGHLSDLHPGRYILVLLKCSSAALSLSQQQGTGKQQMENKLYICLEDIRFSPALTELFLFIFHPPSQGKCFVQRLEANPATTETKPGAAEGFLKGWMWCGATRGSEPDIHLAHSEVVSSTCWSKTYISFCVLFISSNDLSFLPCISDPSSSHCPLPPSLRYHIPNCISASTMLSFFCGNERPSAHK